MMTKKICRNDNVFSQLPDPIIGHILGFMPLQDAVRTSVLSSEWRFKYLEISKIIYYGGKSATRVIATEKLLSGILRMLQEHDGSVLEYFSLFAPDLEACTEIDRILELVSKKVVRKFLLANTKLAKRPILLDSFSFSCLQLSHLALQRCVLASLPEFAKLVALALIQVITTAQVLSNLISQSPLLQWLSLSTTYPTFTDHFEVTAPNLSFFHLRAFFKALVSVAAPRLAVVSIALHFPRSFAEVRLNSTLLQLKDIDSIVNLHLDYYYMKSLHRFGLRDKFNHLRVLRLSAICFGITHEVKCMLDLMKSCVSLERIIIEAFHVASAQQQDDDAALFGEALDLSCSRIREVQMLDLSGSKTELAFIETMLLKLLKLETMIIAPDLKNVCDGGFNISKLALEFRRTSPLATIKFRNSKECKQSLDRLYTQSFRWQFKN